jgi:hypothetical protein
MTFGRAFVTHFVTIALHLSECHAPSVEPAACEGGFWFGIGRMRETL